MTHEPRIASGVMKRRSSSLKNGRVSVMQITETRFGRELVYLTQKVVPEIDEEGWDQLVVAAVLLPEYVDVMQGGSHHRSSLVNHPFIGEFLARSQNAGADRAAPEIICSQRSVGTFGRGLALYQPRRR